MSIDDLAQRLSLQEHVPEEALQAIGLGLPDQWDVDCFSKDNNRLVLLDGVPCAALVTMADFATATAPQGVHEIVALEVLPAFRRRGIARALLRIFAIDGRIRVNSPCDAFAACMESLGTVTEVEDFIYELRLR